MPHAWKLVPANCSICGNPFMASHFGGNVRRKTCSELCFQIAMENNIRENIAGRRGSKSPTWKGGKIEWKCQRCGVKFFRWKKVNGTPRKYCSSKCANLSNGKNCDEMRNRICYERELEKKLEVVGFSCIRSAGSRGAADIIAISSQEIRVIQVKSTIRFDRLGNASVFRDAALGLASIPNPPNCKKQLWVRVLRDANPWRFVEIDECAPADKAAMVNFLKSARWITPTYV